MEAEFPKRGALEKRTMGLCFRTRCASRMGMAAVVMSPGGSSWPGAVENLMKTYLQYPPRKMQSMGYNGPVEISQYQQFQWVRDALMKEGVNISLPTGN